MSTIEDHLRDWRGKPGRAGHDHDRENWRSARTVLAPRDWIVAPAPKRQLQWLREVPNDFLGDQSIDATFKDLTQTWRSETLISSSLTEIVLNRSYQRIIGLGPRVVPLILRELRGSLEHWFWALMCITGYSPPNVPSGDLEALRQAWLDWGVARQLL